MPSAPFPDAATRHPIVLPDGQPHRGTVFLNTVIDHSNFEIGDYTYASDFDPPKDWAAHLAPYLYPGAPDRIVIGRYCQIAHGARFITGSANHATRGISTFPFPAFDPQRMTGYSPDRRDIRLGHDCWLGYGAILAPGARLGHGVIVGAGAVVRGDVPDFAVVAGNPAQVVRMRFPGDAVQTLLRLRWWDWPRDAVARAEAAILGADIAALAAAAPEEFGSSTRD